jgi:outer membrane protein assembly factor BamB
MTARRVSLSLLSALSILTVAADWPQWMGPQRNGSSPETGLLTAWPREGPRVLWQVPGGDGYSAVVVAQGRAFTLVQRGDNEVAIALDARTGKELWKTRCGPAFHNEYGHGPRSTPAVDGTRLYVQSVNGPLLCLDVETGKIVWQRDLLQEFGAENIDWGMSASPLIEDNLVLAIPGGRGAGVAAIAKDTGKLVWKTGDDRAAYASPVALNVGGQRQVIFFTASGLLTVRSDTGKELWRVAWTTEDDCNICTPLVVGEQLFVSCAVNVGCALFQLKGSEKPTTVWESKGPKSVMKSYWATAVAHNGHLYGLSGEANGVINLHCVELATGKLVWAKERFGKGSVTLADGHLFITTKTGDLILAAATPRGYEEKARVKLLGDNRTVPTIANKKLYLRDRRQILCLDISRP